MSDWITKAIEEEHTRRKGAQEDIQRANRDAEVARRAGPALMGRLRDQVLKDVGEFQRNFTDRRDEISPEPEQPGNGFILRRSHYPAVTLHVQPVLGRATVNVEYVTQANAEASRKTKTFTMIIEGDRADTLLFYLSGAQKRYSDLTELSELLLTPLLFPEQSAAIRNEARWPHF